jgi:hypothetical protein
MLVVIAIQLWSKPATEQTDAWGLDLWAERQFPEKIIHPAPLPPTLADLRNSPEFQQADPKRKREILALWATTAHLYFKDLPGYRPENVIPSIQEKVDLVAREAGLATVTNQHANVGATLKALMNWAFLIAGVVLTTEFVKLWRAARKK